MNKKIIMFGPPGSGKGTLSEIVQDKFDIPHISVGDLLREHIAEGDELGRLVQAEVNAGNLVSDEVVNKVVKERLSREDAKNSFILDGYPRHIDQAKFILSISSLDEIILLKISNKEIMERLSGRRVCPKCGASYHIKNIPPVVEGICDKCGAKLQKRSDEDKIKHRLEVYHEETEPVIDFFRNKNIRIKELPGNWDVNSESDKMMKLIIEN